MKLEAGGFANAKTVAVVALVIMELVAGGRGKGAGRTPCRRETVSFVA